MFLKQYFSNLATFKYVDFNFHNSSASMQLTFILSQKKMQIFLPVSSKQWLIKKKRSPIHVLNNYSTLESFLKSIFFSLDDQYG